MSNTIKRHPCVTISLFYVFMVPDNYEHVGLFVFSPRQFLERPWSNKIFIYNEELSQDAMVRVKIIGCDNLEIPEGVTGLYVTVGFYFSGELLRDLYGRETELTTQFVQETSKIGAPKMVYLDI